MVNGQGYTIDGSDKVKIFIFTGSNITLKNINIINANGTDGPAASFNSLEMIENCSFINNTASDSGGAIYINNSFSNNIIDTTFIDNHAKYGGAIYSNDNINIINNTFIHNTASKSGGANYFNTTLTNAKIYGNFYDNIAENGSGGANYFKNIITNVTIIGNYNNNSANSDCNGSDKSGSGGANCFNQILNNVTIDGTYSNNIGYRGGANYFYQDTNNIKIHSHYINNTGLLFGGANYFMSNILNASIIGNYTNNTATKWGGANYINKLASNLIISGDYINNSAIEGSAIFFDRPLENVSVSGNFINNIGNTTVYIDYRVASTLTVHNMIFNYNDTGSSEVSFTGSKTVNATVVNQPKAIVKVSNNKITVSGLDPGTYTLLVTTVPIDEHYDYITKTAKITVKKLTPKMTAKTKTFKTSMKTKKYTITLKNNKNKVMKNAKVTLKVNRKTYTVKTNSKGQGVFKITNLKKKGTYTAIITFPANKYYNKVTQKVKIRTV